MTPKDGRLTPTNTTRGYTNLKINAIMRVSDPSQKYKIALFLIFFAAAAWWGMEVLKKLDDLKCLH